MVTGNAKTFHYDSVPATAELENNGNQKKYVVNGTPKGHIVLSRVAVVLIVLAMLLLIALAVVATYFITVAGTAVDAPEKLMEKVTSDVAVNVDERLPTSLKPLHYRLEIMPFLEEDNFTTAGIVTIRFECKEQTDVITFNVKDIDIHEDSVQVYHVDDEGKRQRAIVVTEQKPWNESEKYEVHMAEDLKIAKYYEIHIEYTGHLNNLMQGFYRSKYTDSGNWNRTRWLASTQFAPTDARRAFPCFDEPSMKARFQISIAHSDNFTALSNMPVTEKVAIADMKRWHWEHYQETPEMSTYLVAFIVSDLHPFRFNATGTPFMLWTRRDALDQTMYAGSIGPKILKYFENYFNIPFPLPKIDIVAVPDFGYSAMENWGLITFREKSLLFNEQQSTINDKSKIASVMGHEIAHQWFGNLVTPMWWNDLWLKEGFATYLEYLAVNEVEPQWSYEDEFLIHETYSAFKIDCLLSTVPITFDVHNSNQIRQMYSPISYSKGAALNRMLNHIIGEEKFKAGLVKFLSNYKYSNADADGLFQAFTIEAQQDEESDSPIANVTIKEIMETWTKQAGFPYIQAVRNYDDGTVNIKQRRFLLQNVDKAYNEDSLWWIPISYTTGVEKQFSNTLPKIWLSKEEENTYHISAKNNYILLNLQQTGYYIVNYDNKNWEMLIQSILTLPPTTRAQLITDSMYLARANLLNYSVPFKMLIKLSRERYLVPLLAAFKQIKYLDDVLTPTPLYGQFNTFISTIFQHIYDDINFQDTPADSYYDQTLRYNVLSWACKIKNSRCVATSRHLFRSWMTSDTGTNTISPNSKLVVYCTAIREGGEDEWSFAYKQYLKTNQASEKPMLLSALGCTNEPWLLSRYLDMILRNDSGIRKQDGNAVFTAVAENIIGHSIAFDFIRSRWNELTDYYGVAFNRLSTMVKSLPTFMYKPYHLQQLLNFKSDIHDNLNSATQAVDEAIEEVKANIEFMNNSYQEIEEWLNSIKNSLY